MNRWQINLDPERLKQGARPGGTVAKVVAVLGVLPFIGFGVFMLWNVLRISGEKNWKFAIPFIAFVLVICAVPIWQAIKVFKRSQAAADGPMPPASAPKSTNAVGSLGLALFGLPFAGFGMAALVIAVRKFSEGVTRDAVMLTMFGLIFSAVGFGIMAAAFYARRSARRLNALEERHADAPWLWREDWAGGQIRSNQTKAALTIWVFAIFWNAISWMVAGGLLTDSKQSKPWWVYLLVLLFPAIGVLLLGMAVRATLVARRFGGAVLHLKTLPAVLGGALEGTIELPRTLPKTVPVRTALMCYRRVRHQDSDGSSIQDSLSWQVENVLKPGLPEFRAGHTGVPVFFRVPADQPPATPGNAGEGGIVWRVEVEAKLPGPDLKLQFDVPVFGGAPGEVPAEDPTARFQLPIAEQREVIHSRITVTDSPRGGKEFYFPAARTPGAATGVSFFALLCLGVAGFIGRNTLGSLPAHTDVFGIGFALFTAIFPVVFGGVGLLLSVFGADLWLRRTRLIADGESLTRTQQWLFLKRRRELRAEEIRELFLKPGMTSGTKIYHDLKARLDSGKEITLVSALASKPEAEWLAAELKRALGR